MESKDPFHCPYVVEVPGWALFLQAIQELVQENWETFSDSKDQLAVRRGSHNMYGKHLRKHSRALTKSFGCHLALETKHDRLIHSEKFLHLVTSLNSVMFFVVSVTYIQNLFRVIDSQVSKKPSLLTIRSTRN